ncbi:expressed unknown protein [Seminavis robusta]|uniref:PPIase cyclophilin-type domain-containing protein n=1 Tax=Seminavis robusta TaxID=568900 RepID=A0A9N8DXI7_9STRA|nr:expressed unknown protein [Seminavis robusta]|eukprot:Sro321_g116680.1 n/a (698) ;mRNA; r:16753-18954
MTSHHRKRFFSNESNSNGNGNGNGSPGSSSSKNLRGLGRNNSGSSSRSHRSASPPDQLIADLSHSLLGQAQAHFSPVNVTVDNTGSMDSSMNSASRSRRILTPNHSGNLNFAADHSSGNDLTSSSRRRPSVGTGSHGSVQRHHSGESIFRGHGSPRSPTTTRASTSTSARPELQRHRSPPIPSYSNSASSSSTNNLSNLNNLNNLSSSTSTRQRCSPRMAPKRNTSTSQSSGDMEQQHAHAQQALQQQQLSMSMSIQQQSDMNMSNTPYGMLNPGNSSFFGPKRRQQLYYTNSNPNSSYMSSFWNHLLHSATSSSSSSTPNNKTNNKQMIALFAFCTLIILGMAVYQHDAMLQDALRLKEQEVQHHIHHTKEMEQRVQTLRQQNLQLADQIQHQPVVPDQQQIDLETQRKLFHWEHANLKMQRDVQLMSKRLLREKYGHGPKYYVQMKLEFDPHSNVFKDRSNPDSALEVDDDNDVVILETASIEDMPHAVYLFLEQVDHHLYDHTTFHRNAAHIIQAGPSNSPHAHALFRHAPSLNSVIFQEYAPEMSHKQYTLGYPGRPGGPDFYVNMRDNSLINGPGGQHHHYSDLAKDADPCFAKVVRGFETIERIHRSAVMGEDAIVHPVIIESMKVLPDDYVLPHSFDDTSSSSDEDEEGDEEHHHHHQHHHHPHLLRQHHDREEEQVQQQQDKEMEMLLM